MEGSGTAVFKAVRFGYAPSNESRALLSRFREMVNEAIRIGLKENVRGRFNLRKRIYRDFRQRFGVPSYFPYSVAEVAWSILKKHRHWHRKPYARRLMLKLDAASFRLDYSILSLPFSKGRRLLIPLHYGEYQRSFLSDEKLKRGSVTVTEDSVIIVFSRKISEKVPLRRIGYDLNEKSIVGSDGEKIDLSEAARLHTLYGVRRRKFYERHANDRRLKKKFASSGREKERAKQFLHVVAKLIVNKAKRNQEAIVLEKLKGICYKHKRGNGEGPRNRRRIALWPFRQLQSCIEYKARWAGVSVEYVSAAYTSQKCHSCGFINRKLMTIEREWRCPGCGATLDRDLNAAINIEGRSKIRCLGEVRPGARDTDEAVRQESRRPETAGNPASRSPEVQSGA